MTLVSRPRRAQASINARLETVRTVPLTGMSGASGAMVHLRRPRRYRGWPCLCVEFGVATRPEEHANGRDRRTHPLNGQAAGVPVRAVDMEPIAGLHWVTILLRVMSGLLGLLLIVQ